MKEFLPPILLGIIGTSFATGYGLLLHNLGSSSVKAKQEIKALPSTPSLKIKEKAPDALVIGTNVYRQPFSYIINERDGMTKLLSFEIDTNDGTVTNVFVHSAYTGSVTFESGALRTLAEAETILKFASRVYDTSARHPAWATNYALATYDTYYKELSMYTIELLKAHKELLRKAE